MTLFKADLARVNQHRNQASDTHPNQATSNV